MTEKQIHRVTSSEQLRTALAGCRNIVGTTEIVLAEGDYFLETSLALDASHQDLVLRGEGRVRLIGGKSIMQWQPVLDDDILNRLDPAVREHVLVCDLKQNGVEEIGRMVTRGFGREHVPSHAEPFWNGKPLSLSQYPKRGEHLKITGFPEGRMNELEEMAGIEELGFYYNDDRPIAWQQDEDIWVHGYWSFDWKSSYERVKSIDLTSRHVQTHSPYAVSPFRLDQRFYFLNVLEEVRYPGDYYMDRKSNKLYFYPDHVDQENNELLLSLLETPICEMVGSERVSFIGITFECTRGNGLHAEGVADLLVDRCLFRHIGNTAVHIEGGVRNTVRNSTIHDCGDGGINAYGGDRITLTSSEFTITNNHIYRIGTWNRCYNPAVHMKGVGIHVTHNLIHDCPHIAILYWGNDMIIEHNEIYSVCMETGDAGAIYSGRDLSYRGNRVCHNFIHHLGGVGLGTMGIYNDDGLSGTVMEDNFFLEVGRAVLLGGGVDYVVKNNVFVKCYPAITADSRVSHTKFFWDRTYGILKKSFYEGAPSWRKDPDNKSTVDASKSPYMDRYPELSRIDEMFKENRPMNGAAHISNNLFCSKVLFRYYYDVRDENKKQMYDAGTLIEPTKTELSTILDSRRDFAFEWSSGKGSWLFEGNYTAQPSDFEDVEWGLIAVREGSEAYDYGYERREIRTIGIIEEDRNDNPPRILTSVTYPYRDDKRLTLRIRNAGKQKAEGSVQLYTSSNVKLDVHRVPFMLAPGEEHAIELGTFTGNEDFMVEARSELAGVRPSRA